MRSCHVADIYDVTLISMNIVNGRMVVSHKSELVVKCKIKSINFYYEEDEMQFLRVVLQ